MNTSGNMRIMDCVRWMWAASRGFRARVVLSGVVGLLHVGVSLLFVWVSKRLIDVATHQYAGSLYPYIALMVGCILLQLAAAVSETRLQTRAEIRMRNDLRYRLFCRLMESRWNGRESMHTGDVLNRLEEDVYTLTDTLCVVIPSTLTTVVQLAGAFLFLCVLDVRLAAVVLFIMPVALVMGKFYTRKMRRINRDIRTTDSRVQTHVQEHLQHRTLISTLEYTPQVTRTLAAIQDELKALVFHRTDFSLFSRSMVHIGFSAGYLSAFLWGVFGIYGGTVTFGMMTAFLQLVGQVQRPMVDLSRRLPTFIRAFTSVERLADLEALPLEEQGDPVKLGGRTGIRFSDVSFTYPDGKRQVISGFTHDFTPGSLTALTGETGAGKSTLIRLMLALLLPNHGSIQLYDDRRTVAASPLTRCNLVYVPQGNTLMSGTIRQNLLMGNPHATDDQLRAALHTAVAEFVYTLPDGLDTLCGEAGTGLSEGQAQRVAIARGLLRPGGILLLDEPTSSLDSETERTLLSRLSEEVKDKTLILVTHREAAVSFCLSVVKIERR